MAINVSIAGGSGYAAGELLRVLAGHSDVHVGAVYSASHAGARIADLHAGTEELGDLRCGTDVDPDSAVLFLCLPHGESETFLRRHDVDTGTTLIDLSSDHRHLTAEEGWVYGLPETARPALRTAREHGLHVSNPGCFATAVQLGLLPLFAAGRVREDVHTSAITGSTGAGRAAIPELHFSWRDSNLQAYKLFTHQHLREMRDEFLRLQPSCTARQYFVPYRGPFTRGIIATSYTAFDGTAAEARSLFNEYYESHPFVRVTDRSPDIKRVVNTNYCLMSVDVLDGMCVTVSVIDNLLKGAAGQAVQNMNLLSGLDERSGLLLKASAF